MKKFAQVDSANQRQSRIHHRVREGCHNKGPQSGGLQKRNLVLSALEVRAVKALVSSSYKDANPIKGPHPHDPTYKPDDLPKAFIAQYHHTGA